MNMYSHVFTGSAPLQAPQESVTQQPVTPEPTPLDQVITEPVPLAPAPEPVTQRLLLRLTCKAQMITQILGGRIDNHARGNLVQTSGARATAIRQIAWMGLEQAS